MRLYHAIVALLGASAAVVIAAPLPAPHTTINDNEVFAVYEDLKPIEKSVPTIKPRTRNRFRSPPEGHLRKRTDKRKKEGGSQNPRPGEFPPPSPTNPGDTGKSTRTKPIGGIAADKAHSSRKQKHRVKNGSEDGVRDDNKDADKDDDKDVDQDDDGESEGHRRGKKKAKKTKKKEPKQKKPKKKGGDHGDGDKTGSDDDPDTDNASENENGTDNDDD